MVLVQLELSLIVEIAGEDSLNGEIRFEDSNSSNYVAIKAPTSLVVKCNTYITC